MAEFKARLVDKDGNPLGTAANPLKISGGGSGDGTWNGYTRPATQPLYLLRYNADGSAIETVEPSSGSQVNSDWNAATGVASILNKPTIPSSSDGISIPVLGTPSIDELTEYINSTGFTGKISGGTLTDGGSGTLNVASGAGLIRNIDSDVGPLFSFEWAAASGVALTDDSINYIYVDYNSGTPVVTVTTDRSDVDFTTMVALGRVYRLGTTLNIIQTGIPVGNLAWRVQDAIMQTQGFAHSSGATLSSPSGLKLATTDGLFYFGIVKVETDGKNTSGTDTFTSWYRNGSGGWTKVNGQTDVSAQYYDDGDGTLGTVTAGRYCVHWVYILYDGSLHVQYGQVQNSTLATAQAAQPPSPPSLLANFAVLVGKVIVLRGASTIYQIQSAWSIAFEGSTATNHADLINLEYANAGHTGFQPNTNDLTVGTPADTDYIPYYDVATSGHKKALKSAFGSSYTLPTASGSVLGGVKIGSGITITDGVISASGNSGAGGHLVQRSLEGVVYETTLMYWVAPATCTVSAVSMALSSNPSATGSYCKVQVMKNGLLETDSIFSADAPMQITESTTATNGIYQASGTLDEAQLSVAAGDVLHFRINQADTGSADLLIQAKITFS